MNALLPIHQGLSSKSTLIWLRQPCWQKCKVNKTASLLGRLYGGVGRKGFLDQVLGYMDWDAVSEGLLSAIEKTTYASGLPGSEPLLGD